MGERALASPMTVEEYYAWGELQDERYEFVDGYAVPKSPGHEMPGASVRHDRIVLNVLLALGNQLRGKPCRAFTADTAVAIGPGRRRRPDAGIDCGPFRDDDYVASEPRLVVEVLSPSTRDFDMFGKLDEYKSVPALTYLLLVEPNAVDVLLWTRDEDRTWSHHRSSDFDSVIELPALALKLNLADIYEGLTFRPAPRLVDDGQ